MSALVSVERVYQATGIVVATLAWSVLRNRANPKRVTTALFWGLIAASLSLGDVATDLYGKVAVDRVAGVGVVLLALIAGFGGLGRGEGAPRDDDVLVRRAEKFGNALFVPALSISVVALVCTLLLKGVAIAGVLLLDKQTTIASLGVAIVVGLVLACWITKSSPFQALDDARGLVETIGWAVMLPMMLAMLGGVFVAAKTGETVKHLIAMLAPEHHRFLLVTLYCFGMAAFTFVMGNAFAAFPVMTAGIAMPFLIRGMGAHPAPLVAIGMCAGYCGTLVTPMAANFNILPASLLELEDRFIIMRVQFLTALLMFMICIGLMYFFAFG
jgi:uncharacterized membrane protein